MAKHPEDFCCNPEKAFTRKRKLPFEKVMILLVKMRGHSLRDEILDCLDFKDMPAETLITSLDADNFSTDEWKHLYHLRWSIEASFRQLKYTIGLSLFQSKGMECIVQLL